MGTGFFPLDKELGLGPVGLMPQVHQALVRLGASLPFEEVAEHLDVLFGVQVSKGTVIRQTEQAGRGCLAVQDAQADPLAPCAEEEPAECMVMSGDGAFVPLVHGEWGEVKQVVVGHVEQTQTANGLHVHSTHLSCFARLADASTLSDQLSGEVRRRGLDRATRVCAVQDGAEWLQGLVQAHRADAVRILDFAHAAGRVASIGEVARLVGMSLPSEWLEGMLHRLKQEGATSVLLTLTALFEQAGQPEAMQEHLSYLRKREAHMDYPTFQAQGWPIGSGMVESSNKRVMQARLKGAGMHWVPENVNPMLALRMNLCNGRWKEGWTQQQRWHAKTRETKQRERQLQRVRVKEQHVRELRTLVAPPVPGVGVKTPLVKLLKGRTEAQKRWGRQTFSSRLLRQGGSAKI